MFAPISAISALLFFAATLPNGIRIGALPATGDSVEIVAGYTSGGLSDLTSTAAGKSLLLDAYAVGAKIQFISEFDRTALRLTVPQWAAALVTGDLPAFFKQIPEAGDRGTDLPVPDFRAKIEEEIRSALLGPAGAPSDYATEDAFILSSAPLPAAVRDAIAAVPKRASAKPANDVTDRLPAERTLRFKSDLATGGVVFASPAPAVYYKQWYLILLLDRLIHRVVTLPLQTSLPLTSRPYYYRIESPLSTGQFPEPAEESLLQELQRLQFTPAKPADMTAVRRDALAYLDSKDVREWFESHDMSDRRLEGIQWLESITTDDLRAAARDLLIMNHVVATWAPKPKQTSVSVESVTTGTTTRPASRSLAAPNLGEARIVSFPAHVDPPTVTGLPETLSSGVSLAASNVDAIFIAGGPLTRLDHAPAAEDLKVFAKYPASRILVLTPASSMDRMRELWSTFKGNASGEAGVPQGKVSTGDLPALFILKTILDMKVIEAGWWHDVTLHIDAGEGSNLEIAGDPDKRAQVVGWIKGIGTTSPDEKYFNWAREVAIHRFDTVRPDLQSLTWERDHQGALPDLTTITPQLVQDVVRIYF